MKSDIPCTFGGNMFRNHVVTKKKGGGTSVVAAKWTQMLKSVMT